MQWVISSKGISCGYCQYSYITFIFKKKIKKIKTKNGTQCYVISGPRTKKKHFNLSKRSNPSKRSHPSKRSNPSKTAREKFGRKTVPFILILCILLLHKFKGLHINWPHSLYILSYLLYIFT